MGPPLLRFLTDGASVGAGVGLFAFVGELGERPKRLTRVGLGLARIRLRACVIHWDGWRFGPRPLRFDGGRVRRATRNGEQEQASIDKRVVHVTAPSGPAPRGRFDTLST